MKRFVIMAVASVFVLGGLHSSALAIAPFKKAFQDKYVEGSGSEEFKAAFQKASCNVCHVKGKKKEERNEYGKALDELLEGNSNKRIMEAEKSGGVAGKDAETKKVLEELAKAFDKVAEMKSPTGETYGELIKANKLPIAE
jgi:hypothetical protein